MGRTNLLILILWLYFVYMERFNHIKVDILHALLQIGRA